MKRITQYEFSEEMSNKILIITYDMIPYSKDWGGSQRMYFLLEALTTYGFQANIICCDFNLKTTNEDSRIIGLKSLNFVAKKVQLINKSNQSKTNIVKHILFKFKRVILHIIKKMEKAIFNNKGTMMGYISKKWIDDNIVNITTYVNKNDIDLVIISGPPFGMFTSLHKIKKHINNDVKFILDYRDPWNFWDGGTLISRYNERKALKYIDYLVVTNENIKSEFVRFYKIRDDSIKVISNGYSNTIWNRICTNIQKNRNKFTIIYTGGIEFSENKTNYRNISTFMKSFVAFYKRHSNVELIIVGVNNVNDDSIKKIIAENENHIKIIGKVQHLEALEYLLNADLCLLLHTTTDDSAKYIISAKLYDYIKSMNFVLSIGSLNSLHKEMVTSLDIGLHVENYPDQILNALEIFYEKWLKDDKITETGIDKNIFSREYQNCKYIDLVNYVLGIGYDN